LRLCGPGEPERARIQARCQEDDLPNRVVMGDALQEVTICARI
jgi:hypothetical protein